MKKSQLMGSIFLLSLPFIHFYYVDNFKKEAPLLSIYDHSISSADAARGQVKMAYEIVEYIKRCNKFPDNYKEFKETDWLSTPCKYEKFVPDKDTQRNIKKPVYPWNDPWGSLYQIRYDLDRGKLQVRSPGRYLWWPWDDIIGETSLSIPKVIEDEMLDHCKKVPKDDMSCVFNRGWH